MKNIGYDAAGVVVDFTIDFTVTFTVAPTGWKKSGTFSTPLDGKNPAQNDFCPTRMENVPEHFPPHGVEYGAVNCSTPRDGKNSAHFSAMEKKCNNDIIKIKHGIAIDVT